MSLKSLIRRSIVAAALVCAPVAAFAGVFITVGIAPPPLPVYTQPLCPAPGYLWTPGYWAYGDDGYYWVPGVWVQPPAVGLLWTPPYWGFAGGYYGFHEGYWGPHVGFYGGINYGFGFTGVGFAGGYWQGNRFAYNTAVTNVNRTVINNTYVKNVTINNYNNTYNHSSFNGGTGGVPARPTPQEMAAEHENHVPPTINQQSHFQAAAANRANFASANGGHPQMAAMQRVGAPNTAVPARGANVPQRQRNEQARINQGVRSGQLTNGETRNLDNRSAAIHQQAVRDRTANGGQLNPQERQRLNQRQNNVSRSIYQDKHNEGVRPEAHPQERPRL